MLAYARKMTTRYNLIIPLYEKEIIDDTEKLPKGRYIYMYAEGFTDKGKYVTRVFARNIQTNKWYSLSEGM